MLFLHLILYVFAQNNERVCGIYVTGKDFMDGKLSYVANDKNQKIKIRLNDFLVKPYVTVQQNDSTYKFLKTNTYGFKKCNNQILRFKNKRELLLLNSEDQISIYKDPYTKIHAGSRINVTNYYFSIGPLDSLRYLTRKNLKAAFPDNKIFHSLIDTNFKYNTDLAQFDKTNNMYKINWFLKESMK